ncbi:MAG: hypothetical protein ACYDG2_24995, partial [Ruminiclostridium sp.]
GAVAYAAGNPYENFKAAVVETMKADNMTVSASVQMKQNGAVVAQGDTLMQRAGADSYSHSSMKIGDKVIETEHSSKDGVMISRQGDEYFSTSFGSGYKKQRDIQESPNMTKLMEMMADLVMGDVKNQFVANGDTISVSLTDAQIPELANVAMAAFSEMSGKYDAHNYSQYKNKSFGADMANIFPITQDAAIKSVKVNATLKDGRIAAMDMNLVMTGQDKDGKTVSVETTVNGTVSELGTTAPQQIDTTGKTVTERSFDGRVHR